MQRLDWDGVEDAWVLEVAGQKNQGSGGQSFVITT